MTSAFPSADVGLFPRLACSSQDLEAIAAKKGVKLILPTDVIVADKFAPDANAKVVPVTAIPDGWLGLDNGPESTALIQKELADAKTIIWNGPMGVFEFDAFAKGTTAIAETLAELTPKGVITIVGGGDSVAAVEKAGLADKLSHVSTGGGASLELLEGKVLPGVAALNVSSNVTTTTIVEAADERGPDRWLVRVCA